MKFSYRIEPDELYESPREWDNLGTMVCSHPNYELGDVDLKGDSPLADWLSDMLVEFELGRVDKHGSYTEHWMRFVDDLEQLQTLEDINKAWSLLATKITVLPLYLYDHSGLTMSTSYTYPYNDRWDAGQVGFIYVSYEKMKKEFGWKYMTGKRISKTLDYLRSEVDVYDQYLTGDVWGYIVENDAGDSLDSCWGFYGRDECVEEAERMLAWEIKNHDSLNEFERVI